MIPVFFPTFFAKWTQIREARQPIDDRLLETMLKTPGYWLPAYQMENKR
jgi:hypothetical protein